MPSEQAASPAAPSRLLYRERSRPPAAWWAVVVVVALGVAIAVGAPFGPSVGLIGFAVACLAGAAMLLSMALTVEVDEHELRADGSAIPHAARGQAHALDRATTQRMRGRDADPAAFTVVRSYVPTAVAFEVRDETDPTPYWLVSTRRPSELAAVLRRIDER